MLDFCGSETLRVGRCGQHGKVEKDAKNVVGAELVAPKVSTWGSGLSWGRGSGGIQSTGASHKE